MYNILIVDDEPIILSGIKFLINWDKNDCTIMDTARNGREALEKIRACQPDIILCDIKMPVMDGLELLKQVNEEYPSIVFVMLSNLQEFQAAKEAISNRAVEYLLKSQLEPELLEDALNKAKKEASHRSALIQADRIQYYDTVRQKELIHNACMELLFSPDITSETHAADILLQSHMFDGYGLLYISLDFSSLSSAEKSPSKTPATLTAWEKELCSRMADSLFGRRYLYIQTGQEDCLTMYLWGQGADWERKLSLFADKLASASGNITQVLPVVCPTPCFYGKEKFAECKNAYFHQIDSLYLSEAVTGNLLSYTTISARTAFEPLGLTGIGSQLETELNAKNLTGATLLLDKAIDRLTHTYHQKSQAIWLCNELYRSCARALPPEAIDHMGYQQIKLLRTRGQVLSWIDRLKEVLTDLLSADDRSRSAPIEKARQYVSDHVEEQINLQDVADYVFLSPNYLSSLFKKQYGQSFISYINQVKVNRACELIRERKLLIGEIAFQLGYENAYYFARVFRRYTGMSPSEWEKKNCK